MCLTREVAKKNVENIKTVCEDLNIGVVDHRIYLKHSRQVQSYKVGYAQMYSVQAYVHSSVVRFIFL
jgi:hypothetical protein